MKSKCGRWWRLEVGECDSMRPARTGVYWLASSVARVQACHPRRSKSLWTVSTANLTINKFVSSVFVCFRRVGECPLPLESHHSGPRDQDQGHLQCNPSPNRTLAVHAPVCTLVLAFFTAFLSPFNYDADMIRCYHCNQWHFVMRTTCSTASI